MTAHVHPLTMVVAGVAWYLLSVSMAAAQDRLEMHRIGILHPNDIATSSSTPFFFQRLKELGYVEGKNITILRRSAKGRRHLLPNMATELVGLRAEVIVGPGSGVWAAVEKTRTIPIVVAVAGDLVARGWAESVRRPGGNVTGLTTLALGLAGKQLQLLKEIVPKISRVAVVGVRDDPEQEAELRQAKEAAAALHLSLSAIRIKGAVELPGAFDRMKNEGVKGVLVLRHGILLGMRREMASRALTTGLPTLFGHAREAAAGGLMAYGADTRALWRGAADYVDKILNGTQPAELPISRATKFTMTVNLKTARLLGIAIPSSILLRADRLIE